MIPAVPTYIHTHTHFYMHTCPLSLMHTYTGTHCYTWTHKSPPVFLSPGKQPCVPVATAWRTLHRPSLHRSGSSSSSMSNSSVRDPAGGPQNMRNLLEGTPDSHGTGSHQMMQPPFRGTIRVAVAVAVVAAGTAAAGTEAAGTTESGQRQRGRAGTSHVTTFSSCSACWRESCR